MNVARSHDLPFSRYCGINMATFCHGLMVGEAMPKDGQGTDNLAR